MAVTVRHSLKTDLYLGLPPSLLKQDGERLISLLRIQGLDQQVALVEKQAPELFKSLSSRYNTLLTGRFASSNTHRIRQATPYLIWSMLNNSAQVVQLAYVRSDLPQGGASQGHSLQRRDLPDAPALGLPHLVILDWLGYLDLPARQFVSTRPWLTIWDGANAYRRLLERQQLTSQPQCNMSLGIYSAHWPYLVQATLLLAEQLEQWTTLTTEEQERCLEVLWAVSLLIPNSTSLVRFYQQGFLQQAFLLDETVAAEIEALIAAQFGLPADSFIERQLNKLSLTLPADGPQPVCSVSEQFSEYWRHLVCALGAVLPVMLPPAGETPHDLALLAQCNPLDARIWVGDDEKENKAAGEGETPAMDWRHRTLLDALLHPCLKGAATVMERAHQTQCQLASHAWLTQLAAEQQIEDARLTDLLAGLTGESLSMPSTDWLHQGEQLASQLQQLATLNQRRPVLDGFDQQNAFSEELLTFWQLLGPLLLGLQNNAGAYTAASSVLQQQLAQLTGQHAAQLNAGLLDLLGQLNAAMAQARPEQQGGILLQVINGWRDALAQEREALRLQAQHIDEQHARMAQQMAELQQLGRPLEAPAVRGQALDAGEEDELDESLLIQLSGAKQEKSQLKQLVEEKNREIKRQREQIKRYERIANKQKSREQPRPDLVVPGFSHLDDLADALISTLPNDNIPAVLQLSERFSQGRLRFTSEAYQSASLYLRSEYSGRDLLSFLLKLAFDYLPRYQEGGDNSARHVFGEAYSASESDTVIRSERLKKMREFSIDGRQETVLSHLSVNRHLRIYFLVQTDHIVVPYVGKHLECATSS